MTEAAEQARQGKGRKSLWTRLLRSFLLVLAIPSITLPLLTLTYLYQNSLQVKMEDSLSKAIQHARYVENLLETRAIEVLTVGLFPETRRYINLPEPERPQAADALRARVQGYFLRHGLTVDGFHLLDARGRELLTLRSGESGATAETAPGTDHSRRDYYVGAIHLAAIRGRHVPVHLTLEPGSDILHYSSLVMDDRGIIAGVLVLDTSLPRLLREVAQGGPGKTCAILDTYGEVLYGGVECAHIASTHREHILGRDSGILPPASRFPSVMHVFSRVHPPGQSAIQWTIVHEIALEGVDAPFQTAALMVGGFTLGAVLLSIAFALGLSRQVTRPLAQLATAANDICRGYWDTLLPTPTHNDEISDLTRAFASMSRQLRTAHESLLAKIQALGESEQRLAEEKERLAVTLRGIGDAVIACDLTGKILFHNPAANRLLGLPPNQVPTAADVHLTDPLSGEPVGSLPELAPRGEAALEPTREFHLHLPNGVRTVELTAAPIRNPRSETIGVVIVLRDVTRARELAEEQNRVERLNSLGILAGGIAHDFNNLMAVVMGDLSLLEQRLPAGDPDHDIVVNAIRATRRARGLTQQLLTFSKGGAPVKRSASLRELAEESARFAMHGSSCAFHLESPADLWCAEVDPGQIHQVFHNLVLNAVQAMPNGGTLTIRMSNQRLGSGEHPSLPPGDYVRVVFRDTGCGIPPHLIHRVFDPYFTTKETGSGLGLSSVHSIVTAHGGHISVQSSSSGTEFILLLPAHVGHPMPQAEPTAPSPTPTRPLRILLLDDQASIQATTTRLLEHLGHRVSCVTDGAQAIDLYVRAKEQGDPFDLCLLDLTVPGGMGGRETLARLRQIDPNVRAIVTSGYSQDEVMARYTENGFRAVLQKPFTLRELESAVANAIH